MGTLWSALVCAFVAVLVGGGVALVPGAFAETDAPADPASNERVAKDPFSNESGEGIATEQPVTSRAGTLDSSEATDAQALRPSSATLSGLPWRSGVFSHDVERTAGFEAARGRPVDVLAVFPTRDSWDTLMDPWWMGPSAVPEGFSGTLNVGLPLFPDDGSLEAAASGAYDEQWRRMGELIASRYPDAYVRPGWEFNIPNWRWAATEENVSEWQTAFQRASVNLRAGGTDLRIVWNPNEGRGGSLPDATRAWPGDEYVDVVAIDAYDWYPAYTGGGWEEHRTKEQGWDYWGNFAREHEKSFAVPEWGVMTGSPASGGDNPQYITAVLDWMAEHADIMEFETYFEETEDYCRCALSQNPAAQEAYTRTLDLLAERLADVRTDDGETPADLLRGRQPGPAERENSEHENNQREDVESTGRVLEPVSPAPVPSETSTVAPHSGADQVCWSCSACASSR